MFVTLYNLIPTVLNALFDTFYICAWFYFLSREFYKIFVYPLKQEIKTLKSQQDILYQAIKKLKNIMDIDNNSSAKQLAVRFKRIKSDLDTMYVTFGKRFDKIDEQLSPKSYAYNNYKTEDEDEDEDDENENDEEDETSASEEDDKKSNTSSSETNESKYILPIQNHITFPNNAAIKKTKDTYILSNQLCDFLEYRQGITMEYEDVYKNVLRLIKGNKKITRMYKIKIVPKIRKLFGISENEDYEITSENLQKFLEPHLK